MKTYIKKKAGPQKSLGYRTADNFKSRIFGGKLGNVHIKFNPSAFKTQHKG